MHICPTQSRILGSVIFHSVIEPTPENRNMMMAYKGHIMSKDYEGISKQLTMDDTESYGKTVFIAWACLRCQRVRWKYRWNEFVGWQIRGLQNTNLKVFKAEP